jgi:glycerol-3-phosphate dehydrogenase (NAD(P)+)
VKSRSAANPRVGVLGAGSFGTALAVHAAGRGLPTRLWARDATIAATLHRARCNEEYLPGVELPANLEVSNELSLLADCDPVLVAVPSHGLREIVRGFFESTPAHVRPVMVSASKGVEVEGHARMSEVLSQEASRVGRSVPVAAFSGPTFAGELARGVPSAAVIASDSELLASRTLRLYSSSDRIGVELGGATKNVIAIGAGMVHGLALGQNTLAALITRGLHELTRLGVACGGRPHTFSGLAGLGDLVLTCTAAASRNRAAGIALAEGRSLEEIRRSTHSVAEGLINTRSVASLAAELEVEMPITEQMEAVIYGGRRPALALAELMTRDLKAESE